MAKAKEPEDINELFASLQGDVSQEQWEMYKELKRVGEGLICSDDSDLSQSDDDDPSTSRDTSNLNKSLEKMDTTQASCESSDNEEKPTSEVWDDNLTLKYLDGEVSFDFIAKLMEKHTSDSDLKETESLESSQVLARAKETSMIDEFDKDVARYKKKKRSKRRGNLPQDLQGLMGEANLCVAQGKPEDAMKMCMEVIRLAPYAAEPFQTLAIIYEEMGDIEKWFQFSLIGAYLNPSNLEEWDKLAQMCIEREDLKMAAICYTNAIKCDNKNINTIWERSSIYEQLGEKKNALRGYEMILNILEPIDGDKGIQLCREIVKLYQELSDFPAVIKVLEKTGKKFGKFFTLEDINMLVQLQISERMFLQGLSSLQQYCGVVFEGLTGDIDTQALTTTTRCTTPETLHIDLQSRLAVCLINLKQFHLVPDIVNPIFRENPEEIGDLYLDIAEAYMNVDCYVEALAIFEILTQTESYNLAAVWLLYGECLSQTNRLEDAVGCYQKVVEMAPAHLEARGILAGLLEKLGRTNDAIKALDQEYEEGNADGLIIDAKLLLKRCNLLYDKADWVQFMPSAKLLLTVHCYPITNLSEIRICLQNFSSRARWEALNQISNTMDCSTGHPKFTNDNLDWAVLWGFYQKVFQKLYELKEFEVLEIICLRQLTNKLFVKFPELAKEVDFLAFLACYYAKSTDNAYDLVKYFATQHIDNNRIWNLFAQMITFNQDVRHNRFCLRLMAKHPEHKALGMLNGHTSLIVGSYKHALGDYMHILHQSPDDAHLNFCVGLTFIQLSLQKFSCKKDSLVAQALAFLKRYWELRGECQEVYYNLGRAMHGLGLSTMAVSYYKKGLAIAPPENDPTGVLDLSRELSYNLALIYQASGSTDLARHYIQTYCVV